MQFMGHTQEKGKKLKCHKINGWLYKLSEKNILLKKLKKVEKNC